MSRDLVSSPRRRAYLQVCLDTQAQCRDYFRGYTVPSGWTNNGGRPLTVLARRLCRGSDAFPGTSREARTASVTASHHRTAERS